MSDPSFSCPNTESSLDREGTEDGLYPPPASSSQRRQVIESLDFIDPLFVSPSNQEPSENIAPYLSFLFPTVPERAKQNNVLLTSKEIHCLEYYIEKFDSYCPEYDVTIVVDGGAMMEKEIESTVCKFRVKLCDVERVGECCIIRMRQFTHEYAAVQLYGNAALSDGFNHWRGMADTWGRTAIKIKTESVCTFFDSFPGWGQFQFPETFRKKTYMKKRPDFGSVPAYTYEICGALGMTPVPTLAIKSTIADNFRNLFHDCISFIVGALLQLNAVIGVNNSPETFSVDILNFDLTVNRMMKLARSLEGEQYSATRGVLHQVAKMKASIHVLQLKLLDYILSNPDLDEDGLTQQDVQTVNEFIREDLELAKELCPFLDIRPLELSRFPEIDLDRFQPFLNDIKAELAYYERVLTELYDCKVQARPQEAVVQCTLILVAQTIPVMFGPTSKQYLHPQGSTVEIPIRALAGIGDGYVNNSSEDLTIYMRRLSPEQKLEQQTYEYTPIPLEWINDPSSLAADRGIPVEQMSPAKYNPRETLCGKIKFRYLTDEALEHIVQTSSAYSHLGREEASWLLAQLQVQKATKPRLEDVECQNNAQRRLSKPSRCPEYGRVPSQLLPSSCHRKGPMHPTSRGIHTMAHPLRLRRGFYPKWSSVRAYGTLWKAIHRLPRR